MALGSRPVADQAARRRLRVMRAGFLALALMTAATAEALDVGLEPYREARRAGALGSVGGRVFAEPAKPNAPSRPLTGTTITLLPRSPAFVAQLERLKQGARESSKAFAEATPAMRKARDSYERELLEAGAPDLTPLIQVDTGGTFRIDEVPAGAWLLLGWHSVPVDVSSQRVKPKERQLFKIEPRVRGFQSVTVWLRELNVMGGRTASVDLTDRNGWFRGVIEEKVLDGGR